MALKSYRAFCGIRDSPEVLPTGVRKLGKKSSARSRGKFAGASGRLEGGLVNHNRHPLPLFFISVASKGLRFYVSGLESTLASAPISVDSKGSYGRFCRPPTQVLIPKDLRVHAICPKWAVLRREKV